MNRKILGKCLTVLLIFTLVFSLAACTNDKKTAGDKEVLVVGLDDTFAPMGFRDEKGELVGFDIDLARAVGDEIGMDVEFKPINWDAKDLELSSGNIDCIWNGMSQTPAREESMELSKKYLNNKIVLMTNKDIDVKSADELSAFTIGTQAQSSALEVLEANDSYESFKDNIKEYGTYDEALLDLKTGRVDVLAIDQVLGEFKNNNLDGALKVCTYDLGEDYYVIGFKKGNTELRDKVNEAISTLIDNGTAEKISNEWFGKNIVISE